MKHQYLQETFVSIIVMIEEAQIMCTQYSFMDILMVPKTHDKNAAHVALCHMITNAIYFLHCNSFNFENIFLLQYDISKMWGGDHLIQDFLL